MDAIIAQNWRIIIDAQKNIVEANRKIIAKQEEKKRALEREYLTYRHHILQLRTERLRLMSEMHEELVSNIIPDRPTATVDEIERETHLNVIDLDTAEINSCRICFENFSQNETVRVLNCTHYFHQQCITRWMTQESATCPICRLSANNE